jgi:pimeloyl-ACP methyl ester carboxylesterase
LSNWISGESNCNGVRIHYERTGGRKPALLMLHGMADNGLCWSRVAKRLQGQWDVLMLDARGHGLSDAPETGYTAEEQAPDVAGLIQALGLERPVLMGHSMGAATAVATAARYPALVRALILEDPPWGGPPEQLSEDEVSRRQADWRALILKRKAQTQEEIVPLIRRRFPSWDERDIQALAAAARQVSPNIVNSISAAGVAWQDVVKQVTCPVWAITADPARGAIVTPERIAEARRICPALREIHIEDAGHNIRREQFGRFVAAAQEALARVIAN